MIRLSGITPSGHVHVGNHLGAIRRWADEGGPDDLYFVSDLHAMTTSHNPAKLRSMAAEQLAVLIAAGIEPDRVFVQSDIARELGALNWVLECTCNYGEAARMIQFKEKSKGRAGVRLSLLTYPVLMAADILLQGADEVPVGEDQRQHVELARTLAKRFNSTYGEVFTMPKAVLPPAGARIMDLSEPTRKMSKSTREEAGVVFVLDEADQVRRKVKRAVTDGGSKPVYAPETRPGMANLLDVLAACVKEKPDVLADQYASYGQVKEAVAEALIEELRPVRERALALLADPGELERVRKAGAVRAAERGEHRLQSALRLIGAG
ncbi:tryptophan--tRNA ligase [Amycolatopsis regifaucium]|uniref:Tryptophan--tRNA ligase n=1 Tax=Amycolatopsis regifaucium TaxID=546365 RepID=A0A154MTN0_9PSEU|nr:tryptophan--tRNA ligase [Amycolatopsis regifaucium]KZB87646.1 tryptophan--tRNA ligase [Amycolatopsis regifaucium]OKA05470.1 tryptophan--tRNA ligase [Amycolatopsis regifaucium]SFI11772.1 tryptophanyl-tRNA synthetase [Amycolatopsis regifaucium]